MSHAVLMVHWGDVVTRLHAGEPEISPQRLGQALRRYAACRWGEHTALALGDWEEADRDAGTALRRCGFDLRLLAEADRIASEGLARAHAAVVAARPERVAQWVTRDDLALEILCPDAGSAVSLPEGTRFHSLADFLARLPDDSVGLFVAWESLVEGYARRGVAIEPRRALPTLLRLAAAAGDVAIGAIYAPWAAGEATLVPNLPVPEWVRAALALRHQPSGSVSLAEDALMGDLQALLERTDAPRTWIVAGWHPGLAHLAPAASARGRRVILWLPPALTAELPDAAAAYAVPLADLLDTARLGRAAARDVAPPPAEAPIESSATSGARLSPWVRLVYLTRRYLIEHQCARIAVKRLAALLAGHAEFGPTPANALGWIQRARSEGLLRIEQDSRRHDPAVRVAFCRPELDHALARAAVEVPDRIVRLLHQMLGKMPWVSFKLLRSVLLREQWLGGPELRLDEPALDEWLNFLVRDGALVMTKEPNAENPDFPVTALRLRPEHPVVASILRRVEEGRLLALERAILAIDHFLVRTGKPWMAMSTLRRTFAFLGKDELQGVLRELQARGALRTATYPNPQKDHATTGCVLDRDDALVQETLARRLHLIRVLQRLQRFRAWTALARWDEESGTDWQALDPAIRLAWFALLRDEGLVEIEFEGPLPLQGWGGILARLNLAHPVVRAIVAETAATAPEEVPSGHPGG